MQQIEVEDQWQEYLSMMVSVTDLITINNIITIIITNIIIIKEILI